MKRLPSRGDGCSVREFAGTAAARGRRIRAAIATLLLSFANATLIAGQDEPAATIEGIGPIGPVERLAGGFQFTEGPTAADDGTLYFTDIPANRIYRVEPDGEPVVFVEPSSRANGLMLVGDTELLACQMDGRLVSINLPSREVTVLAESFQGQPFNACNDLVVDRQGGVYFTDPHYGAAMPLPQGVRAVYYRTQQGEIRRLIDDLAAPNGVILAPDERTLYVVPSEQKQVMAYPILAPGEIGEGSVHCELRQSPSNPAGNSGGDGLTVDTDGNLYITSGIGIQVIDATGNGLGVIPFPEQPANVTFGGPERKTLIVTARTSVYIVPMATQGHVFPGKK